MLRARNNRHARAPGGGPCRGLAAHQRDGVGSGTDEGQPGIPRGCREMLVLGKEAVPRVQGVGARTARDVDEALHAQIAVARSAWADRIRLIRIAHVQRRAVALGIDRDRRQAHLPARADNAHGDLAAVRDDNLLHWS